MRILIALLRLQAMLRRYWQDGPYCFYTCSHKFKVQLHMYSVLERTPHGTDPAGATQPISLEASQGRKRKRDVNSSVLLYWGFHEKGTIS